MKICIENSTWNNIGDGFYQAGIEMFFTKHFPQHEIVVTDGPIARAFKPSEKFKKNSFHAEMYVDADLYILSGPILNQSFFDYYESLIRQLVSRGKAYAMVSVHGSERGMVTERIKAFLREFPPVIFSTRDVMTTNVYSDLAVDKYDGLCFAYCAPRLTNVPTLDSLGPAVAISCYSMPEPRIHSIKSIGNGMAELIYSPVESNLPWKYARHMQWRGQHPADVDGYKLIRLIHDLSYKFSHLNFSAPNSYLSYNPKNFLAIYKSVSATLSDRVHACVVSLAFGKKTYYVGNDPRDSIFDRPAFVKKNGQELTCNVEVLNEQIDQMFNWIKSKL